MEMLWNVFQLDSEQASMTSDSEGNHTSDWNEQYATCVVGQAMQLVGNHLALLHAILLVCYWYSCSPNLCDYLYKLFLYIYHNNFAIRPNALFN